MPTNNQIPDFFQSIFGEGGAFNDYTNGKEPKELTPEEGQKALKKELEAQRDKVLQKFRTAEGKAKMGYLMELASLEAQIKKLN